MLERIKGWLKPDLLAWSILGIFFAVVLTMIVLAILTVFGVIPTSVMWRD